MAQIVGSLPEFTQDDSVPVQEVPQEVLPPAPEIETPALQDEVQVEPPAPSQTEAERAVQALQLEQLKLRKEISELRGNKRELKQEKLVEVQKQIDELKDVAPQDVALIDRVLRSKGYMTKEEVNQTYYESVKNEELSKFLDKYPEYKLENDPENSNWNQLSAELAYYKLPQNPHGVAMLLEKAHRAIRPASPAPSIAAKQHQARVASTGSGGAPRAASTPSKQITAQQRAVFESGGWSQEEIDKMGR